MKKTKSPPKGAIHPNGGVKNVQVKSSAETSQNSLTTKRLMTFSVVGATFFAMSEWVCRFGVIDPVRWLPVANVARWFLILGFLFVGLIGALMLIMPRLTRLYSSTPPPNKPLSFFIRGIFTLSALLAVMFLLATGRLFAALVLRNLMVWVEAPHKWSLARQEQDPKLRRMQLLKVPISLLFFALLTVALALQSLPLALVLFVGEQIQFLAEIPMLREQMRRKATNSATQ